MVNINQYELGKKMYLDWYNQTDQHGVEGKVLAIGIDHLNLKDLREGFIDERCERLAKKPEKDDVETFFSALEEVGLHYWDTAREKEEKRILSKMMQFALVQLTDEVEKLEISLEVKEYIPLQRNILERKLKRLQKELVEFQSVGTIV